MKMKSILLAALVVIVLVLLTACGSESEPTEETDTSTQSDISQVSMTEWPTDKMGDLPEYPNGEVINHGDFGNGEYVVKVEGTNNDELKAYIDSLANDGWTVTDNSAEKGIYRADFSFFTADDQLQIILRTADVSEWPGEDELPTALFAPEGYTLTDVDLSPNGDNAWLFYYTCQGMDQAAVDKYVKDLQAKGWVGDTSQMTTQTKWNGKSCDMMLELYGLDGGNASFTVNFAYAQ